MEILNMSRHEVDRLNIINKVKDGLLTQVKAAELLNISDRQIRNLLHSLNEFGPNGIISKKRGKPSNNRQDPLVKALTLKLIHEKYEDFGPTLAAEKLLEHNNINISRETLRKWMIEAHFWIPKTKKRITHPLRRRREYFGDMLQGDASHHDWFETGIPCALLFYIDDATSIITAARFEESESLFGYFEILKIQLKKYGRPISLYTDKFSVFETSCKKENLTQFQRALKSLDIQWIGANSPQAKGRIERFNRTLQDRLIKDMRLRGIKNIEEGNEFLKEYLTIFNQKFSKEPMKSGDLHRPLERETDLHRTLAKYEERTLTKDLIFQFQSTHYKIIEPTKGFCIGRKIEIRVDRDEDLRVFMGNRELEFKKLDQVIRKESKIIQMEIDWPTKKIYHPPKNHPFKNHAYRENQLQKEIKLHKWYNE